MNEAVDTGGRGVYSAGCHVGIWAHYNPAATLHPTPPLPSPPLRQQIIHTAASSLHFNVNINAAGRSSEESRAQADLIIPDGEGLFIKLGGYDSALGQRFTPHLRERPQGNCFKPQRELTVSTSYVACETTLESCPRDKSAITERDKEMPCRYSVRAVVLKAWLG